MRDGAAYRGRMTRRDAPPADRAADRAGDRAGARDHALVPFWAHQVAEILLAVVLLFEGARNDSHVAVIATGALLLVFSLLSKGPVAAWPLLGRRAHRVGDFSVAAVLAVSPLVLGITDVLAIVLLEGASLVLVWLGVRTDFAAARRRARRPATTASPRQPPPSTPASPAPSAGSASSAPSKRSVPSVRSAGRSLGRMRAGGPRAVGRALGKASAERAADRHADAPAPERAAPERPSAGPPMDEASPE
jgi:hypothetical protein